MQFSVADEPASGGTSAGTANSCTDEKPKIAYANENNGKVDLGWYRLAGAVGYDVEVQRLNDSTGVNRYFGVDAFGTDSNSGVLATRYGYTSGIYQFRVRRKATGLCATPGTWSAWWPFSVGSRPAQPVVPPLSAMEPQGE